jgi:hypothetical protein
MCAWNGTQQTEGFVKTTGHFLRHHTIFNLSMVVVVVLLSIVADARAQSSQTITLPLSATSLNVFNFGVHSYKVQYPPGTAFSGVFMTVTAVQLSQSSFHDRVAGTQFSHALCVVYAGESGFCIDYKVACANAAKHPIACPKSDPGDITVESSFNTEQSITNPGFLDAPNQTNLWTNILFQYFQVRIDPTPTGHTKGFSEFVVAALGATNGQGPAQLKFNAPMRNQDPRVFPVGTAVPVSFSLASTNHPGAVTDATASLSVLLTADPAGTKTPAVIFAQQHAFLFAGGSYSFTIPSQGFRPGTYALTVYGDAFPSTRVSFTMH